jgi:ubiquinone/menaquinone biosynthesis C-methylase UbiE
MDSAKDHYSYRVYGDPETARTFDQQRFGGPIGEYIRQAQESAVFSALPDVSGWSVIDVGAGTGRFTFPFLQKGANVTACDASEHMLEVLRSKADEQSRLQTQIVDAHNLPFPDRSFDCAISFRILMHLPDWKMALTELCRVTKDWLAFDFPPKRGFLMLAPMFHIVKRNFTKNYQPYRVLPVCEIREHLKSQGFEIQDVDHGFFLPIVVHRILASARFSRASEKFFSSAGLTRHFGSPVTIFARRSK